MIRSIVSLAVSLLLAATVTARAADVTIGRATEQNSLDPLYSDLGNDVSTAENMFDSLIRFDSKLRMHPSLALSWTLIDPLTWEIKLRTGVKFHDGSDFTAADVAYSLRRARSVPNSPGPLSSFVGAVKETEIVDPHTIRVHTIAPTPLPVLVRSRAAMLTVVAPSSVTPTEPIAAEPNSETPLNFSEELAVNCDFRARNSAS